MMKINNLTNKLLCFILLVSSLLIAPLTQADAEIVFVQTPANQAGKMNHENNIAHPRLANFFQYYQNGSHIFHYNITQQDRSPINLTNDFIAACDPSISFDAKKMLFSGKKTINESWQIWCYDLQNHTYVQITNRQTDCIQPIWVGNLFHLDDDQPSDRIVFVSRENDDSPFALYASDLDGSNILKITHNLWNDFHPVVLNNGRVVYSSERFDHSITLMAVNNDGTDVMPYLDEHENILIQTYPVVSFDERLYFLEKNLRTDNTYLSFVSTRRPLNSKQQKIKMPIDAIYPCPLPDGSLLLSKRNPETGCYELVKINGEPIVQTVVSSARHCLDAQLIKPMFQVNGRSTVVDVSIPTGVFYCIDVYRSNIPELEAIEPGSIKKVNVYQGIFNQNYKKILGTAPVEEDGSFHIEVPAQTPLNFELLNTKDESVMKQKTWTWVMPNEKRGCIGCHEDREMVPPNRLPMAVTKPAVVLPAW